MSGSTGTGRGGSRGGGSGSGSGSFRQGSRSGGDGNAQADLLGTIHGDLFTRDRRIDKRGSSGKPTDCFANFIPIETHEEVSFYQYHVEFSPDVDSKAFRQQILQQEAVTSQIGTDFIFDGMIMYLNKEWTRHEEFEAKHPITGATVCVKFKNSVRFGRSDPQAINCYNIIIRRCFDQIGYKQMGRNYFDPQRSACIKEYKLEVWPGYETAIRAYEENLMLCVENRFKVLRAQNMYEIMCAEFERSGRQAERMHAKIDEMYGGQTIVTYYNNKMHRLTRVDWDMTPLSTFKRNDGSEISLKDYYKNQYGMEIENLGQPIIISEGKPKQPGEPPQLTYLIPEHCQPTGLTDDMRKDMKVMRALSFHTRLDPEKRRASTLGLLERIHGEVACTALLDGWMIRLGDSLVKLAAREMPPESLVGRPAGPKYTGVSAEWSKEIRKAGVYRGKDMINWIVVCPSKPDYLGLAQRFIGEMTTLGRQIKMTVRDPMCESLDGTSPNDYINGINNVLKKAQGQEVHMMVVLLADDNKTRYDAVKKMLCTDSPVPSQCVLLSTLAGKPQDGGQNKNFGSIVLKILLQINCKMGGALWKVPIPMDDAMIMGYDLYHDSTMKGKTVGACVSTIDKEYTEFYSQTRPHENPTELGTNLIHFVRKALRKYYVNNNKTLPSKLFLYRDGAGDGQIPYIRNEEVRLVRSACEEVVRKAGLTDHKITLAFTIVTKKVNMRIFRTSQVNGEIKLCNPNPGTVVDSVVTRPERLDFYLVPQYVNQGTVTPVCYNIIYDDTGLTPDRHQRLAFKLCHLYYNWQGTVRVPAPCQYAHKLAFLVAQSIHREADETIRDKLFFL